MQCCIVCVIFHSNYYTTHNEHVIRFFVGSAALGTLGAAKHRHRTHGKKYCLLSINHLSWQDLIIRHAILFLLLFDPRFGCFWGRSKKKTFVVMCSVRPAHRYRTSCGALWLVYKMNCAVCKDASATHDVSIYRVAASGEVNDCIYLYYKSCSRYATFINKTWMDPRIKIQQ